MQLYSAFLHQSTLTTLGLFLRLQILSIYQLMPVVINRKAATFSPLKSQCRVPRIPVYMKLHTFSDVGMELCVGRCYLNVFR